MGLAACMATAAMLYGLPPRALPAIQKVEGGQLTTVSQNKNGTRDLGLMQINSRWLGPIGRVVKLPEKEVEARLLRYPCFNITASAAILHVYLREAHGDIWRAIGYYHSHTPVEAAKYRLAVAIANGQLRRTGH